MTGFHNCVWWRLKNHPINRIVVRLAETLRTPLFEPHISIRTHLRYVPVELPYPENNALIKVSPDCVHDTSVYLSSWNTSFHAIELPVNGPYLSYRSHVSLAYRVGLDPFTREEVEQAKKILGEYQFGTILPEHLDVCVYDCSSVHPREWSRAS
jgi:hypothetical protein